MQRLRLRFITSRSISSAAVCLALWGLTAVAFAQTSSGNFDWPVQQPAQQPAPPSLQPQIAIIIDDLGYRKALGERAIQLPGAVTVAILPYRAHTQALANSALVAGKEFLLHAPMEPRNQVPWEDRGLSSDLSHENLHLALANMVNALPQAAGINNHMGSKFTEDGASMQWLMGELKQQHLLFVDSVTTPASVAWQFAQASGVPSVRRDVFLDNVAERAAVEAQLNKLVAIARSRGYALGIGHPRAVTLDVLEAYLPRLPELGVELVSVSRLIERASEPQLQWAETSQATNIDAGEYATGAAYPAKESSGVTAEN